MFERHNRILRDEIKGLGDIAETNVYGALQKNIHTYTFLHHLTRTSLEYAREEAEIETRDLFGQFGERLMSSGQEGVSIYAYTSDTALCIQILQTKSIQSEDEPTIFVSASELQSYQGNAVMFAYDTSGNPPFLQAIVPDEETYTGEWRNRGFWIPERFERLTDDQKIIMGSMFFRVASRCYGLTLQMKHSATEASPFQQEALYLTPLKIESDILAQDLSLQMGDIVVLKQVTGSETPTIHDQYCIRISDGTVRAGRIIWDGAIAILCHGSKQVLRLQKDTFTILGKVGMKLGNVSS